MKTHINRGLLLSALLACGSALGASAQGDGGCTGQCGARMPLGTGNPYLPLWEHLPDGEPRVFDDPDCPGRQRVYIIGSHDVRNDSYCGPDIHQWSAPVEDLTNWRDEGPIFSYHVDGQWDVMYAPDLVCTPGADGRKVYWLYPHSRGPWREAMVCRGDRPDGPFTPVNLTADGRKTKEGSFLGFDPSIFVEPVTDKHDADFKTGFRAYGFWGFQRSSAAQLDQQTMWSVRPGTEVIPYFIPACARYGGPLRDPEGTTYPALLEGQQPGDFNFFEASSIRQVGNKYVMIFSGHSGPDYGIGSSNSTLRYAYGDSPLGPWRSGGVLVDSRGVVPNEDGTRLITTNAGHNTHGSLQQVGGQWYVFYHRPPRGFGFARQAMVAPVHIEWDKTAVRDGGKVRITGFDAATRGEWTASASDGSTYTGAEVTSEGFQIHGLDPFRYYSVGYACFLTNGRAMQDNWDVWANSMDVQLNGADIVGFKYFNFGGLRRAADGQPAFRGARRGDHTALNLFLTPRTDAAFSVDVMLDGPWATDTWRGRKIATIDVPAGSAQRVTRLTADVAEAVEGLSGKHGLYLIARGADGQRLADLHGIAFSRAGLEASYPAPPTVEICADGHPVTLPTEPVHSTNANGIMDGSHYEAVYSVPAAQTAAPVITASASCKGVKINVIQPTSREGAAVVTFDRNGMVKTYTVTMQ